MKIKTTGHYNPSQPSKECFSWLQYSGIGIVRVLWIFCLEGQRVALDEFWIFYGSGLMSCCWDAQTQMGVESVSQLAGCNSSLIYGFGSCSEFPQYFMENFTIHMAVYMEIFPQQILMQMKL